MAKKNVKKASKPSKEKKEIEVVNLPLALQHVGPNALYLHQHIGNGEGGGVKFDFSAILPTMSLWVSIKDKQGKTVDGYVLSTQETVKKIVDYHLDGFKPSAEDIKNLYYLDEMIKDMHERDVLRYGEKYMTFLHDWYDELYKKVGHTDAERAAYLKKNWGGMDRNWIKDNFLSIEERDLFLEHEL